MLQKSATVINVSATVNRLKFETIGLSFYWQQYVSPKIIAKRDYSRKINTMLLVLQRFSAFDLQPSFCNKA